VTLADAIDGQEELAGARKHTLRFFEDELDRLRADIVRLGRRVEGQVRQSVKALVSHDALLAKDVVDRHDELHECKRNLEKEAIRLIALRQPLADDLRLTISAIKMGTIFARVADFACNIAKRAIVLADRSEGDELAEPSIFERVNKLATFALMTPSPDQKQLRIEQLEASIFELGQLVCDRLKGAVDAFAAGQLSPAMTVWEADQDVDDRYGSLISDLLAKMVNDPRQITLCSHLLFAAKNLERIGDYATGIADVVHYDLVGDAIVTTRPKGDNLDATALKTGKKTFSRTGHAMS
jgi:phosphate transport system protein